MIGFVKEKTQSAHSEDGISLIELLVSITLLTIAIGAITGMVISSMRTQQEVSADFRSQMNTRTALYDMEKNISESLRRDSSGNEPIFQDDLISVPSQNEPEWITYTYTDQHPDVGLPTIVKVVTDGMPTLPLAIESGDKQMINVDPDNSESATVERVSYGAPIFK
jgi:type II secretory pathway component PulJ